MKVSKHVVISRIFEGMTVPNRDKGEKRGNQRRLLEQQRKQGEEDRQRRGRRGKPRGQPQRHQQDLQRSDDKKNRETERESNLLFPFLPPHTLSVSAKSPSLFPSSSSSWPASVVRHVLASTVAFVQWTVVI